MYTLVVNDSLRFNIDGFNEDYNKHLQKTTLTLFAEDEIDENVPLTSLAYLAREINKGEAISIKLVVGDSLALWESDAYTLDSAHLGLQKKSMYVEDELVEKDVIISSMTFSYEEVNENM